MPHLLGFKTVTIVLHSAFTFSTAFFCGSDIEFT